MNEAEGVRCLRDDFRVPERELEERVERVQACLSRQGIDCALVVQSVDLFYLTGSIQQGDLLVPARGEPVYLVRKDVERARRESALPTVAPMSGLADLGRALGQIGIPETSVLGLELDVLPVNTFRRYERLFKRARLVDCSPALRETRAVKSAFEVALMQEAGRQVDLVYQEAARVLREGMSEIELASHLESVARRAGHHGLVRFRAFNQELYHGHVLSGPNAAVGSYLDTPLAGRGLTPAVAQGAGWRTIQRGEPVVLDLSGGFHGYLSDQTRVLCIGHLPSEFREAYGVCLEIQERVVERAQPGVLCRDLYKIALEHAEALGLSSNFMGAAPSQVSFVGHGVGLEIDEPPYLARAGDQVLLAGNVIAVEPKLVFPGRGAVGVENTWLVTEAGPRALTVTSDDIVEV